MTKQRTRQARLIKGVLAALCCLAGLASVRAEPRQTMVDSCMPCHGVDGIAPASDVPHLAGQNEVYLFNQLMAFRSGKRQHRDMRFMARSLTREDIAALAAYYASLPPR